MMACSPNQSQPYSPVRSTDLIHTDSVDHSDEPDLFNSSNEEGIADVEAGYAKIICDTTEEKRTTNHNAGTTPDPSSLADGVSNRIVVGAAQRASRGANLSHSSSSSSNNNSNNSSNSVSSPNTLASTRINAPYLPPPSKIECGRCQLMRPRDASHCHDCGVCVKKLDHHCPVMFLLRIIAHCVVVFPTMHIFNILVSVKDRTRCFFHLLIGKRYIFMLISFFCFAVDRQMHWGEDNTSILRLFNFTVCFNRLCGISRGRSFRTSQRYI